MGSACTTARIHTMEQPSSGFRCTLCEQLIVPVVHIFLILRMRNQEEISESAVFLSSCFLRWKNTIFSRSVNIETETDRGANNDFTGWSNVKTLEERTDQSGDYRLICVRTFGGPFSSPAEGVGCQICKTGPVTEAKRTTNIWSLGLPNTTDGAIQASSK